MISSISIFCLSYLLLLNLLGAGAKPVSSLQTLRQFLEADGDSRESLVEQKQARAEKSALEEPAELLWRSDARNSALAGTDEALERILGDLLSTSKRSWSRFKKGGMRSCFGVRLERIGSFSGLGC